MFGSAVRSLVRPSHPGVRRRPALAVETLDDRITPSWTRCSTPPPPAAPDYFDTSCTYFNSDQQEAQTFTVGKTGTLTEVDLYVSGSTPPLGDLIVDVRACQANGRPLHRHHCLRHRPRRSVIGNPRLLT